MERKKQQKIEKRFCFINSAERACDELCGWGPFCAAISDLQEQVKSEEANRAGTGAYLNAMHNWQLAQDDALEKLVEKVKELERDILNIGFTVNNELS